MGKRKRRKRKKHQTTAPATAPDNDVQDDEFVPEMDQETYLRERAQLIEMETSTAEHNDRAALTLSAGALALSLTFIEKIAPNPLPTTLCMIGASWLCFILSIVAVLFSFQASQIACRRQREIIDKIYETGRSDIDEANAASRWTEWLNYISFGFFVVGVLLLANFAWINLPHRESEDVRQAEPTQEPVIPDDIGN